jgi:hypothetical protein
MFGAIGASWVVMKDNTFPSAAIMAMNVRLLVPNSVISREMIHLTNLRVITH